jgi:hypothetical protein
MSSSAALSDLDSVTVDVETANGVMHGMHFVGGGIVTPPPGIPFRVLNDTGELLAVYTTDGERARPEVVLPS